MKVIRKKAMTIDGQFKRITLYEYRGKWGTHGLTIIHFTEQPEIDKKMIAYKNEDFMTPQRVIVWKMAEGLVYVNLN